jgi:hypothetical protein
MFFVFCVLDAFSRDRSEIVNLRAGQCFSRIVPKSYRTIDRENLEKRTYGVILADKHVLVNEKITLWCKKLKFAKYELN